MMATGEFDFVFTNHNFQSEFDGLGYRVIARWAGEPIRTVIAVPADSPVATCASSTASGRLPVDGRLRRLRRAAGRAAPARGEGEEVFAGNQEGAMAQLKARRVEAGAVNSRFLAQYAEREGLQFREIFVSEGYPELAVIVHPRVPAATVDKLRQALIGMEDDPAAAPILARVRFKGFEPATDRDYDGVRRVYRQIGQ